MRELNECINAANDMLRNSDPIKSELIERLIRKAFELGDQSAKNALIDSLAEKRHQ